jgi:hypothetical protein
LVSFLIAVEDDGDALLREKLEVEGFDALDSLFEFDCFALEVRKLVQNDDFVEILGNVDTLNDGLVEFVEWGANFGGFTLKVALGVQEDAVALLVSGFLLFLFLLTSSLFSFGLETGFFILSSFDFILLSLPLASLGAVTVSGADSAVFIMDDSPVALGTLGEVFNALVLDDIEMLRFVALFE